MNHNFSMMDCWSRLIEFDKCWKDNRVPYPSRSQKIKNKRMKKRKKH